MADSIKHSLAQRAAQLDLARGPVLESIQKLLEARYPGQVRAKSLNNGVLKVITPSSAVASELRLHQVAIIKELAEAAQHSYPLERLLIQIQTI